jgi:hypothetical protein
MAAIARNLRAGGRRQRLLMGIVLMTIAVIGGAAMIATGLPHGLRVVLFLPFYMGAVGLLQYRDHT